MRMILLLAAVALFGRESAGQIIAGSSEDKLYQQIKADTNAETKLQTISEFEKQFPQSKALADIYLLSIDLYREKGDRSKVIEYGEKVLKLDQDNITAMMVLARNYAMEGKNLDRAVDLAQQAVDRVGKMQSEAPPPQYTDAQWKDYLQNTSNAAKGILIYTKGMKKSKSPN